MVGICEKCPGQGGQRVKVVVSFGLVALVIFAALCVVVGERIAPRIEQSLGIEQPRQQYTPGGVSYDELRNAPLNTVPVNEKASREIKRQDSSCPPCNAAQSGLSPFVTYSPSVITQAGFESHLPQPTPAQQQPNLVATPVAPKYSLAVFVGTDAASNQLLDWVNRDPQLSELRKGVNFQAYTKDNPLYKERWSAVIPADQFPAIVFADPRGGHVYVAGSSTLPTSARSLYSALKEATEIQQRVARSDSEILGPSVQEFDPNCPDGNCKPGREPFLNPDRQPLFPNLRPHNQNPVESLLYWIWNPGEALLAGLCGLAFVVLLFVVALKVIRS
jgi:hypothetical protein